VLREPFYPVNVREAAVLLGVIDAVTHDKALIDLETYVVYRHVNDPSLLFVDERANVDGTGL
jgi:hypothetical protein